MATATTTRKPRKATTIKAATGTVRMILELDGVLYRVAPVEARDFGALRAFRMRRAGGDLHHVVELPTGAECSCPDFVFRRDGKDPQGCRHVRALRAFRLIGA